MPSFDRRLAAALACVAGYVDAVGFLMSGGFFVSFMSGNSTRLGIGVAEASRSAAMAGAIIAAFVAGAVAGALAGAQAGERHRIAVMGLVCGLMAVGAGLASLEVNAAAIIAVALAMGAVNTVFAEDGEVKIGLTYMTGNLVKLGVRIAARLRGERGAAWTQPFWLWLGLLCGAIIGAGAYHAAGAGALWLAAAVVAALTVVAEQRRRRTGAGHRT